MTDEFGNDRLPHSSHWGAFSARWTGKALEIAPHPGDPAPSPLLGNFPAAPRHQSRIARPLVRRGWLENGPGPDKRRGKDQFVELSWDEAVGLLATELGRVKSKHGSDAVFGGSYGWSSAGRFHHAQSQVHRFLNCIFGGYVRSVNNYSNGTAAVILPHVLGRVEEVTRRNNFWSELAEHAEMIVAFGGMPVRNAMVSSGGNSEHVAPGALSRASDRGARFVLISPIRDDLPAGIANEWLAPIPGTDCALMLGIAHVLDTEDLSDSAFLSRYTVGFEKFRDYLLGRTDGIAKTPAWASKISGVPTQTIQLLAREMAKRRTLISVSYSLQRARHGEQPVWMGLTLAAMLGQIGIPGGGFALGLGGIGNIGKPPLAVPIPTLPQGTNASERFIPVARIADLLLSPGETFDYNGKRHTYPDIRLVYWAGGNPFHHHQDLTRLAAAFARPDTVIVHEPFSTATARHADFILPSTITLEREDIGAAGNDPKLVAMHRVVPPFGEALDDFEIFRKLAAALGLEREFTAGRSAEQWLRHLYEPTRRALLTAGQQAPDFDEFWSMGELTLPCSNSPGLVDAFRADPELHPLLTPSGRIEIFSERIAGFGYNDCHGHPSWIEHDDRLNRPQAERWPIQLIANQPSRRLHSQLDFGAWSALGKVAGREAIRIHPSDAAARGIKTGDVVKVFNDQGMCLAGAVVSDDVRASVAQLSTGAWWDPQQLAGLGEICVHGNPNVLTPDVGTSKLSQGCAGQLVLVQISRFEGIAPEVTSHRELSAVQKTPELRRRISELSGLNV